MHRIAALFLASLAGVALAESPGANSIVSPAERSVLNANRMIAAKPKQCTGYNQLAIALSRRARETSDPTFYAAAQNALEKSFELSPRNLEGEKIHVWLLLGRHEFPNALEAAKALIEEAPNDVLVYGFLADASAELGNYADAEKAAQRMLDLHPGNLPALTRAAYLRELFGDIDGAYDLMEMAYQATPVGETEDRAWVVTQMAHLRMVAGDIESAEALLKNALHLFPGYHYALSNLAKIRQMQARYAEAVGLLQQLYAEAPHAENLYLLAEAFEKAGRFDEAQSAFAEFEMKSLKEAVKKDNSSRELIFYYADHRNQPAKALEIAQQERAWRHDVYTLDAYAWALHVNGRDEEARKQLEMALAVGIRDVKLFEHAVAITAVLGDLANSERYRKVVVQLNRHGAVSVTLPFHSRGLRK
jgi:tetratricopeptide (TPR) repeat protein